MGSSPLYLHRRHSSDFGANYRKHLGVGALGDSGGNSAVGERPGAPHDAVGSRIRNGGLISGGVAVVGGEPPHWSRHCFSFHRNVPLGMGISCRMVLAEVSD